MKVISWNLNHRINEKAIPADIGEIFVGLGADTVLLNEFVDGESRGPFRESLKRAGYLHQAVSPTPARHNQVFAASRFAFLAGDIQPPQLDSSAMSNFLHIRFPDFPVELVGMRAPAYLKAAERNEYWTQLAAIMDGVKDRAILFTGDVNYNPFNKAKTPADADHVCFHLCREYRIPNPKGDWSYISLSGTGRSRIDHVLHTNRVDVSNPEYITRLGDRVLAGARLETPITDHAVLRFEVAA